ncbi:pantoate--beta-alanine ligase [Pseudonocardia endophytica]|uniref:pantoate--beta-alanine ligase n=1 Tax=Pseudonocardia endophytica TaxID=401976 RepID=UPI001FB276CE|nr:pantoate--beta-alanine ligase [Pseudonocardia endophytica]
MTVHSDPAQLAPVSRALRGAGRRIALIPTMGALHEGHRELIRHAKRVPGAIVPVVSIFVNPLQFGPNEDLSRYPRPLEADLEACREEGVELVFTPQVEDMYPPGADTTVDPGVLGTELEGASRPGHFAGVLTVCSKLFHVVGPDVAMFGEKDYQQLVLIKKMVRDLQFPLSIVGVPTVREPDGLALSSRNVYLSDDDRARATLLSRALAEGAGVSARGPEAVLERARELLAAEPDVDVDYLELRSPDLGPAPDHGEARLLVAARLGTTRLIDNCAVAL